eukprot:gene9108-10081_t
MEENHLLTSNDEDEDELNSIESAEVEGDMMKSSGSWRNRTYNLLTSSSSHTSLEDMPFARSTGSIKSHGTFPKQRHRSIEVYNESESVDVDTEFEETPHEKLPIRPVKRRLVEKNGQNNVRSKHIPRSRYALDVFTTIIDARWKWMVFMFIVCYLATWVLFATFWWLVIEGRNSGDECFQGVNSWATAFLYSVETQQTIGYGTRALNSKCPEATILLICQTVIGMLLDAILLGLVFAKLARPNKRTSTVLFSENACISKRDGKYCLLFQVSDVRKRQLPESHVRAYLYRSLKTKEGRTMPFHHESLHVGHDHQTFDPDISPDRLFLLFPVTVVHIIDATSPFYTMSKEELLKSEWEIVVVMEGVVEATGCTVQARTSYLSDEIYWAHDFIDVLEKSDWSNEEGYRYDLFKMNVLCPSAVPPCSAKEFYESIILQPLEEESSDEDERKVFTDKTTTTKEDNYNDNENNSPRTSVGLSIST